jgi:hypothetical protein
VRKERQKQEQKKKELQLQQQWGPLQLIQQQQMQQQQQQLLTEETAIGKNSNTDAGNNDSDVDGDEGGQGGEMLAVNAVELAARVLGHSSTAALRLYLSHTLRANALVERSAKAAAAATIALKKKHQEAGGGEGGGGLMSFWQEEEEENEELEAVGNSVDAGGSGDSGSGGSSSGGGGGGGEGVEDKGGVLCGEELALLCGVFVGRNVLFAHRSGGGSIGGVDPRPAAYIKFDKSEGGASGKKGKKKSRDSKQGGGSGGGGGGASSSSSGGGGESVSDQKWCVSDYLSKHQVNKSIRLNDRCLGYSAEDYTTFFLPI